VCVNIKGILLLSNQYKGWLQNPERRNRQQKSLAFTDSHVQELLAKIDHIPQYCKKSLGPEIDRLLRLRDRGLVVHGFGSKELVNFYQLNGRM